MLLYFTVNHEIYPTSDLPSNLWFIHRVAIVASTGTCRTTAFGGAVPTLVAAGTAVAAGGAAAAAEAAEAEEEEETEVPSPTTPPSSPSCRCGGAEGRRRGPAGPTGGRTR